MIHGRFRAQSGRKPRHLFTAAFDPMQPFVMPSTCRKIRYGKLARVHLISIIAAIGDFADLVILGRSCVARFVEEYLAGLRLRRP